MTVNVRETFGLSYRSLTKYPDLIHLKRPRVTSTVEAAETSWETSSEPRVEKGAEWSSLRSGAVREGHRGDVGDSRRERETPREELLCKDSTGVRTCYSFLLLLNGRVPSTKWKEIDEALTKPGLEPVLTSCAELVAQDSEELRETKPELPVNGSLNEKEEGGEKELTGAYEEFFYEGWGVLG
ncbi:hypothetical protein L208DRAFT_1382347 [Tricholoma matsutake]|nr:hypothetical protein L208DRAFT_1382347 [Tricholoma matsutake 945]